MVNYYYVYNLVVLEAKRKLHWFRVGIGGQETKIPFPTATHMVRKCARREVCELLWWAEQSLAMGRPRCFTY
uniref:Uncharacterized protein n=1 Tax=Picea glauca TaxID=3330 RepID=A0A124GNW8_PICGL|nr:hypothetical protein ABT39_MTgene3366 [Picea glauca]QHR89129.1 hypothetical protein Q903MT_gene3148 [Picea sitchensis]